MHLTGLDHVQLAMPLSGEATARQFYEDVLGLHEVEKPPILAARGGCWFENETLAIHLGVQTDFMPATKAHVALLVNDLEAFRTYLEQAGITTRPDDAVPGVARFYADDPFGNRIEFIQDGQGFSQKGS